MRYGYARVSTKDQCVDRQFKALEDNGIRKGCIYVDKASGKDFNRRNYLRLFRRLRSGDELFVKSIDRLGRNYDEIIEQWNKITKEKEANIVVLDCPLLDTRKHINGVTGKFIADLVLQILSYVAQVERENIHQRQMEGIRVARQRGVVFGRSKIEIPDDFYAVATRWQRGQVNLREGAEMLSVSHTTFSKWLHARKIEKICK
ncbi:recombinase family protein [Gardnerella vaginalis]|uniref:Recombinase family protein n=1 Tax=Gardnerella vaginalis TaxID=2702 RepID=A0AAW6Y6N7_GARVA|nr:recombinase family protein [Gardnerella vaginalis]MDK7064089.1 recombinase family protein [Gardnerella vaginalis]